MKERRPEGAGRRSLTSRSVSLLIEVLREIARHPGLQGFQLRPGEAWSAAGGFMEVAVRSPLFPSPANGYPASAVTGGGSRFMARPPNYSQQKKQREEAARKKREEKQERRQQKKEEPPRPPNG